MTTIFVLNGLFVFASLNKLTNHPSFITDLEQSDWLIVELRLLLPLSLLGLLCGGLYKKLMVLINGQIEKWQVDSSTKIITGALGIAAIAIFTPNLLFSGQTSLKLIGDYLSSTPVLVLFLLVALKLVFLQLSLSTGWIGGDIFPIIFSAILQGFAFSLLFPGIDTLFVVSIISKNMILVISHAKLISAFFLLLFFPTSLWPIMISITSLLLLFSKVNNQRKLASTP